MIGGRLLIGIGKLSSVHCLVLCTYMYLCDHCVFTFVVAQSCCDLERVPFLRKYLGGFNS
jgi:hypothetical protein